MSAVLCARSLGKRYGRRWALNECDLEIPAGHVVGLVGPNGAGKTTLLHLAVGLLTPSAGSIDVLGEPAERRPGPAGPRRLRRPGHADVRTADGGRPPRLRRAHEPGLGREAGTPAPRRPRPRPGAASRHAVGRPAGPARTDPRRGEASRVPGPRRAGGEPRPVGPAGVPPEPDGGRRRPRGQRRAVVAPRRRPRAGM